MRTEPVQCDFQPLLAQNAPSICGDGFATDALWSEDFEDGLAGWTAEQELADLSQYGYFGGFGKAWETTTNAARWPHRWRRLRSGSRPTGQCTGDGETDFSSRDSIISPIVELPDEMRTPRMSFEHYVATEATYDGGNVKVSVNGGDFEVVPAEAYICNAPGQLATLDEGNTNPMAGEDAFNGTDGGETKGSWGESQVDLSALGVQPGDTVQFRFDIGRDGCGGVDGWYVDDIQILVCKLPTKVTATHTPEPSTFGSASSVNVTVARDGNAGGTPTGDVTLTKADGSALGEATLADGKATIALPADLPVGVHTLTATYEGTTSLASSSAKVTVTVKGVTPPAGKTESTTKAKIKPKKPAFKQDFRTIVKVDTADDSTATGKVVIKVDGKWMGKGSLKNGRLVYKVKKNLKVGKHKLVAIYKGSSTVEDSRDKLTFRVVR